MQTLAVRTWSRRIFLLWRGYLEASPGNLTFLVLSPVCGGKVRASFLGPKKECMILVSKWGPLVYGIYHMSYCQFLP